MKGYLYNMPQANQILYNEISKLPLEKVGKAISFIRFLEQEQEPKLLLETTEENELYGILNSSEMINSSELLAKIKEMPDDNNL